MLGSLSSFTRRREVDSLPPRGELTASERHLVPLGYDAVGEALAAGRCPRAACAVVGRTLASDGASLGEALDGLRTTFEVVRATSPDFAATQAFSVAWSEATLDFLQDVSCEDPLTGLASIAHLRSRLGEVYQQAERSGTDVRRSHALVVVDLRSGAQHARQVARASLAGSPIDLHFSRALQLAAVAEGLRDLFAGGETVARLGPDKVVALAYRSPSLADSVAMLSPVLADLGIPRGTRIWIEGLPDSLEQGSSLLSELAH